MYKKIIPGYFDIKPARWLHYTNLNHPLAIFCISPHTSKIIISDSPVDNAYDKLLSVDDDDNDDNNDYM